MATNPSLTLANAPKVRVARAQGSPVPDVVALDWPNGQTVLFSSTAAASNVFDANNDRLVELCANTDMWYTVSDTIPAVSATIADAGTSGSYIAGEDILTPTSNTGTEPSFLVSDTKVLTATIVNGGSGGTPGASVTLIGTSGVSPINPSTGDATYFQVTGTVAADGTMTGVNLTVSVAGDYTTNPDDISAEPVALVLATDEIMPLAGLQGVTVELTMGVLAVSLATVGALTASPASNPEATSNSNVATGYGQGCTLDVTWDTTVNQVAVNGGAGSQYMEEGDHRMVYVPAGCVISCVSAFSGEVPGAAVSATVVNPGTSGSYVPGTDVLTALGDSGSALATFHVTDTKVLTAHSNASYLGSGGTTGAITLEGTSGTGTKFQATGTVSGGALVAGSLVVTVAGDYTANPSAVADEPVTDITHSALTGCRLTITMGVLTVSLDAGGTITAPAVNPHTTSNSGGASGATLNVTYSTPGSGAAGMLPNQSSN